MTFQIIRLLPVAGLILGVTASLAVAQDPTTMADTLSEPAGCTAIFEAWNRDYEPDWNSSWIISDISTCWGPANDFMVEESMELCDISFYAAHWEGTNRYNVTIHVDAGGVPGAPAGIFENIALPQDTGGPVEATVLDGSGICVQPGLHWISIVPAARDNTTMGGLFLSGIPGLQTQRANFNCSSWDNYGMDTPGAWRVAAQPGCGAVEFFMTFDGSCPGEMTFIGHHSTPGGQVAFLYAFGTGNFTVPGGTCAGMTLGLDRTVTVAGIVTADDLGQALMTGNVPRAACRRIFVQAVDIETCTPSNVEAI